MKLKHLIRSVLLMLLALAMVACSTPTEEPSDTGEAEIPEKTVTLFGGDADYRIVYSDSANNQIKDMMTQLSALVKDATGKMPQYVTDTSKNSAEEDCEILLGVTKREASQTALAAMEGFGYDVRFIGEKLVITASNDALLRQAIDALTASWTVQNGTVTISNKTVLTLDASDRVKPLYGSDGKFAYKIVIPLKASDAVYNDAVYLSSTLSAVTGSVVDICYDERTEAVDGAYEICIGKTTRAISRQLYEDLDNVFEYQIKTEGNQIAVAALQDVVISKAVRELYSDLYSEIRYAYSGTPIISLDYGCTRTISAVAAALPTVKGGNFYGMYQSGGDRFVTYTTDAVEQDYNDYVNDLKADGAAVLQEYSLGNNRYALLESEAYSAYVSYLPTESAIRVYVGPVGSEHPLNTEEIEASAATPELWQLEVDWRGGYANGGMCYVLKLTDGSFMVVDSGYSTDSEADNLYKVLRENTPEGQTPVISAWFITHLHPDHYGGLIRFSTKYASSVEVKGFYYNFPTESVSSSSNPVDAGAANSVIAAMKKWKSAKRYDSLHSGMRIGFAGATVDVLCTHEDVYPMSFSDGNDTCTVFSVSVAGQRILFLGDARDGQSVTMLNTIPASALKSDIVQYSHHGYEGCSKGFYQTVNASTVLWSLNILGYQNGEPFPVFKQWYTGNMMANAYIRESETVKKIIVMGAGTQKLTLPYTPTGERIPDYEAIYNQLLEQETKK